MATSTKWVRWEQQELSRAERSAQKQRGIATRRKREQLEPPNTVDPYTTKIDGREYDADELEFLKAVDSYRTRTGRRFPSYCEVRQILIDLGYRR